MNLSQPILLTQSDVFKVKQDIQQEKCCENWKLEGLRSARTFRGGESYYI